MSHAAELIERHAAELRGIAGTLGDSFADAAGALEERLGPESLREWARIGLGLARLSRRSPEVAVAFFETSPAVDRLDVAALSRWAEISADLADRAPPAAAAFIQATPGALARLEPSELEIWAGQGRRLCRGSWKSTRLAADFFRIGPRLLESLSLRALDATRRSRGPARPALLRNGFALSARLSVAIGSAGRRRSRAIPGPCRSAVQRIVGGHPSALRARTGSARSRAARPARQPFSIWPRQWLLKWAATASRCSSPLPKRSAASNRRIRPR